MKGLRTFFERAYDSGSTLFIIAILTLGITTLEAGVMVGGPKEFPDTFFAVLILFNAVILYRVLKPIPSEFADEVRVPVGIAWIFTCLTLVILLSHIYPSNTILFVSTLVMLLAQGAVFLHRLVYVGVRVYPIWLLTDGLFFAIASTILVLAAASGSVREAALYGLLYWFIFITSLPQLSDYVVPIYERLD